MAVFSFWFDRAVKRKCRPSGKKLGHRCEFSWRAPSSSVNGWAVPPEAETCRSGARFVGLKTISPEEPQVAPRPGVVVQMFILHHQVIDACVVDDIVKGDDVWVVES